MTTKVRSDLDDDEDLRPDVDIREELNSYKVSQIVAKSKAAENLKVFT